MKLCRIKFPTRIFNKKGAFRCDLQRKSTFFSRTRVGSPEYGWTGVWVWLGTERILPSEINGRVRALISHLICIQRCWPAIHATTSMGSIAPRARTHSHTYKVAVKERGSPFVPLASQLCCWYPARSVRTHFVAYAGCVHMPPTTTTELWLAGRLFLLSVWRSISTGATNFVAQTWRLAVISRRRRRRAARRR